MIQPISFVCLVWILSLLLVSLAAGDTTKTASGSGVDDLTWFPAYEEYDADILDPLHGYGSPYGGFSRATRRRLAALPLPLPDLTPTQNDDEQTATESSSSWDPLYTTVRDGTTGQWYACRVYHEDELMPESLVDSMYAPPILRTDDGNSQTETPGVKSNEGEDQTLKDASSSSASTTTTSTPQSTETDQENLATNLQNEQENRDPEPLEDRRGWNGGPLHNLGDAVRVAKITTQLDSLKGLCGQIHKGWWSYEWCNQGTMAQFHVAVSENKENVQLMHITNLGDFQQRAWQFKFDDSPVNRLAKGLREAARVTDTHTGGTICPDTSKPRQSLINIVCCSDEVIARRNKMIRKGDAAHTNGDFAVYDVVEDPEQVCHYNVTVCTPLLCDKESPPDEAAALAEAEAEEKARKAYKENESVMEILTRTLGGLKPVCLQSITGGWWTFEFCHGKSIRQYHEVVGTKRDKNGVPQTTRVIETDHNLGRPQVSVFRAIVPEDEWKFVVNATDKKGGRKPYFELEYTNGDICDDHDVRDAAIVAGNTGAKGLARGSSVRYRCGERYDIVVSEDTTCHYVVNIVVPDLCRHPLFKTPVSKKQVFKCLPIDEPDVDEDSILLG